MKKHTLLIALIAPFFSGCSEPKYVPNATTHESALEESCSKKLVSLINGAGLNQTWGPGVRYRESIRVDSESIMLTGNNMTVLDKTASYYCQYRTSDSSITRYGFPDMNLRVPETVRP